LDFWFGYAEEIWLSVSKRTRGIPYLDFFNTIIFKETKIEIVDYYYSIRDILTDKELSPDIGEKIFDKEFWKDLESIERLRIKYPDALDPHFKKGAIIKELKKSFKMLDMMIENLIDEEGFSVTKITLHYGKNDLETIDKVILALEFLKEAYRMLYSLEENVLYEYDNRGKQLNQILKFLNIATDIVSSSGLDDRKISLFIHPLYHINEAIIDIQIYADEPLLKRIILSEKEKNNFEIVTILDDKWVSVFTTTLNEAIRILMDIIIETENQ